MSICTSLHLCMCSRQFLCTFLRAHIRIPAFTYIGRCKRTSETNYLCFCVCAWVLAGETCERRCSRCYMDPGIRVPCHLGVLSLCECVSVYVCICACKCVVSPYKWVCVCVGESSSVSALLRTAFPCRPKRTHASPRCAIRHEAPCRRG